MIKPLIGACANCGKNAPLITDKCQTCYWNYRSQIKAKPKEFKKLKPIPKVSKKRKIENAKYTVLRIEFLSKPENQICPITGKKTTEIHHKKGRIGALLLDTRYWLAVSREGHRMIEENPIWAKENNFSLDRLLKLLIK